MKTLKKCFHKPDGVLKLQIYSLLIYKHSLKRNKVDLQAINFWSEEVWAKGLGKRFIPLKVRSFFKLSLMGSQTTF